MKISAINESVSLIANIGVILFLGLEMQQNAEMMQSQTRNLIVEYQLSFYERGIENNDFAKVIAEKRLDSSLYPFVSAKGFQYALFVASLLRMWENEFYQYQIGLFDSDEFEARTNTWKQEMSVTANLGIWRSSENMYAPDFRNYLNTMISEISQ